MKANENTMIVDDQVILVPYSSEHVDTYHKWMSSPELRELTASEPLTLQEEYDMQREPLSNDGTPYPTMGSLTMIGDVNLFLKGAPEDEDFEVEVEIMIAEPAFRRRGLALTSLQLLLSYATSTRIHPLPIPKERFVARIGEKNEASRKLFEKLGFEVTKRVAVFEEIEMRFRKFEMTKGWRKGVIKRFESF